MAIRNYQGQEYQASTTVLALSDPSSGFDFPLNTWEDLKLEYGAESKIVNDADGSIGGYTTDMVKTAGALKLRRSEFWALQKAWNDSGAILKLLQKVFLLTVGYGNSLQDVHSDTALVKFQQLPVDAPKSQDALMVELPLLVLDFKQDGEELIDFPV